MYWYSKAKGMRNTHFFMVKCEYSLTPEIIINISYIFTAHNYYTLTPLMTSPTIPFHLPFLSCTPYPPSRTSRIWYGTLSRQHIFAMRSGMKPLNSEWEWVALALLGLIRIKNGGSCNVYTILLTLVWPIKKLHDKREGV